MIDASIIIVNWNTKDLLLDCVNSLFAETKKSKMEIIVVDNASSDDSVKAVKKKFPKITVIVNEKNLGFAKANNIGINKSKGRYVFLLNTDTKALDKVIDRMVDYMDNNPHIGALLPKLYGKFNELRPTLHEFPSLRNIFCEALYLNKIFRGIRLFRGRAVPDSYYDSIRSVDSIPCCFIMTRRKAIDEIGLLDERFFFYGEDIDWSKRFHDGGWDVVYYPEAKALHYGGSSSKLVPTRSLIEMIKAEILYWRIHHGRLKQYLYRFILILHYLTRLGGYTIQYLFKSSKRNEALARMSTYKACIKFLVLNKGISIQSNS